ncbi:dihydrofolate reductase family protein [Dermatobacter hominis]|uniref:dihydrofolate reductase family protein n=1 Tax=Dermatobacter hominis TaxID=2884263 RepID=UPI001D103969|nr:dihydrofolate reductase family protein [Dermatobacter hominis]UDY34406.1 dihydrofolate reductase family protein [Dermatobacter hominis]
MSRTIYLTATTLDGFIADPDHSLEWLFVVDAGDHEGDHARFMEGVGAVIMGASTYEWIVDHEDGRWGYEQPSWVMTHRDLPEVDGDVRFVAADDDAALLAVHDEMLEAAAGKDIWVVGGGELAARLVDVGRLDEIEVSIAPVTLGAGKPLLPRHVELTTLEVDRTVDFAHIRYRVGR